MCNITKLTQNEFILYEWNKTICRFKPTNDVSKSCAADVRKRITSTSNFTCPILNRCTKFLTHTHPRYYHTLSRIYNTF